MLAVASAEKLLDKSHPMNLKNPALLSLVKLDIVGAMGLNQWRKDALCL